MFFFTHLVTVEQTGFFYSPGDSGVDSFFHSPGDSGADGFLDVFADPPGVLLLIAGH